MSAVLREYNTIVKQIQTKIASTGLRQDAKEFQDTLSSLFQQLLTLKQKVFNDFAYFSDNESLDDIASKSLKFLSIDYYMAYLMSKKQAVLSSNNNASSFMLSNKNKLKIEFLNKSVQLYMQFLVTLNDYEILDKNMSKKLNGFASVFKPTLDEITNKNVPNNQAFQRNMKIESFKAQKELDGKLKFLENKILESTGKNGTNKDDTEVEDDFDDAVDDELIRELYLAKLTQLSYRAFTEIEGNLYEIEMLSNFTSIDSIADHQAEMEKQSEEKQKREQDPTRYTERLEVLNQPLLSKTGKVLRNFTLLNDKQKQQKKVFGFGQYGPTMSVEEFLEQEFASGNVLQGGEQDPSLIDDKVNEDSEEWADKETYKAREWDDFTETHTKGSGNTMNRG
ncbi:hypothetical protein ACO0QE_001972 [Hanseniaspora vineae]